MSALQLIQIFNENKLAILKQKLLKYIKNTYFMLLDW